MDFLGAASDRTPLGRTRSLAAGVLNTLRLSRALVQARRQLDLAGLETIIGILCAKSLDLPPEEGRTLLADLHMVLDEVDGLTRAMAGKAGLTEH